MVRPVVIGHRSLMAAALSSLRTLVRCTSGARWVGVLRVGGVCQVGSPDRVTVSLFLLVAAGCCVGPCCEKGDSHRQGPTDTDRVSRGAGLALPLDDLLNDLDCVVFKPPVGIACADLREVGDVADVVAGAVLLVVCCSRAANPYRRANRRFQESKDYLHGHHRD